MDTLTLFIHPDTLIGRTIQYHPFVDLLVAGGQSQGDGSLLYFYSKTDITKQPYVNHNIQEWHHPHQYSQLQLRTPSETEPTLPLNSVLKIAFSPDGRFLAVLGSDSESEKVFIYRFSPEAINKKKLQIFKKLDNKSQLCDIIWSPDSSFLAIGTLSGELILTPVRTHFSAYNIDYDAIRTCNKEIVVQVFNTPVLGMSWSKCGFLIALQSYNNVQILVVKMNKNSVQLRKGQSIQWFRRENYFPDGMRYLKSYTGPKTCAKYIGNVLPQVQETYEMLFLEKGQEKVLSQKNSLRTIYSIATYKRQPCFSPDSSFLVVPTAAIQQVSSNRKFQSDAFVTLVYTKTAYCQGQQDPSIILPGLRAPSTCVVFSPALYELDQEKDNLTDLPYQMLFAVAAGCDVLVYSTQDFLPVFEFSGESFQSDYVTDVSFSADGSELCAFGAHFEYQFFRLQLPLYACDFSDELPRYRFQAINAQMKIDYCRRYVAYRRRLQQLQRKLAAPTKPRAVQIDCTQVLFNYRFKIFSVSDYLTTDCQSPPLLHFDPGEIDQIIQIIGDGGSAGSSELAEPANSRRGSQAAARSQQNAKFEDAAREDEDNGPEDPHAGPAPEEIYTTQNEDCGQRSTQHTEMGAPGDTQVPSQSAMSQEPQKRGRGRPRKAHAGRQPAQTPQSMPMGHDSVKE